VDLALKRDVRIIPEASHSSPNYLSAQLAGKITIKYIEIPQAISRCSAFTTSRWLLESDISQKLQQV
jgi:hypothetical protein